MNSLPDEIVKFILELSFENKQFYNIRYKFYNMKNALTVSKRFSKITIDLSKIVISNTCFTKTQSLGILYSSNNSLIKYAYELGMRLDNEIFERPDQHFGNYSLMIQICNIFKICPMRKIKEHWKIGKFEDYGYEKSDDSYNTLLKIYEQNQDIGANPYFKLSRECSCHICYSHD